MIEVLTIAIGTAVMAALIVAADWDLACIQAWESYSARLSGRAHPAELPIFAREVPTPGYKQAVRDWSHPEDGAATSYTRVGESSKTEADEWLAAAAAHRVRQLRPGTGNAIVGRSGVPTPGVWAADRRERPVDADAA